MLDICKKVWRLYVEPVISDKNSGFQRKAANLFTIVQHEAFPGKSFRDDFPGKASCWTIVNRFAAFLWNPEFLSEITGSTYKRQTFLQISSMKHHHERHL